MSEDGAVAYPWRNHFIDREQRTLAKVGFLRIRIRVGSGRTRCFAVEIGGVMIATAIGDLRGKPSEQRLCPLCAVQ